MVEKINDNESLLKDLKMSNSLFLVDEFEYKFGEWNETTELSDVQFIFGDAEQNFNRLMTYDEVSTLAKDIKDVRSNFDIEG